MKYDYDYDPKTKKVITPEGEFDVKNFEKDKDEEFWMYISWKSKLSESFIEKYIDKWDLVDNSGGGLLWYEIVWNQKLSEEFIEKYEDKWDLNDGHGNPLWRYVANYQKLSERLIEKYKDKWDLKDANGWALWLYIIIYQEPSINIILKYYDKVKDYLDRSEKIKKDNKIRMFLKFIEK